MATELKRGEELSLPRRHRIALVLILLHYAKREAETLLCVPSFLRPGSASLDLTDGLARIASTASPRRRCRSSTSSKSERPTPPLLRGPGQWVLTSDSPTSAAKFGPLLGPVGRPPRCAAVRSVERRTGSARLEARERRVAVRMDGPLDGESFSRRSHGRGIRLCELTRIARLRSPRTRPHPSSSPSSRT